MSGKQALQRQSGHRKRNHRPHQRHQSRQRRRREAPEPPPKPLCIVCSDAEKTPNYKCPKCRAKYCSMECYKKHKESCPGKPAEPDKTSATKKSPYSTLLSLPELSPRHRFSEDDDSLEEGWQITEDMKNSLQKSDWLRKELTDGGLRELISKIVASRNVEGLREVQQRFPHFQAFIDKLLVVAGVIVRSEEDQDGEDMEDWLERDWTKDEAPPQLYLKPIPRHVPVFEPVDVSSSSESEESSSEESESESDGSTSTSEDSSSEES